MKKFILCLIIYTMLCSKMLAQPLQPAVKIFICPKQCNYIIHDIYQRISSANKYNIITLYSWATHMKELHMALKKSCNNGAKNYILLNRRIIKNKSFDRAVIQRYKNSKCVYFKYTSRSMHEKMILVDGKYFYNSTNNIFNKPNSYDETIISHNLHEMPNSFVKNVFNEFNFLWLKSKPIKKTLVPKYLPTIQINYINKPPKKGDILFISSSMNLQDRVPFNKFAKAYMVRMKKNDFRKKTSYVMDAVINKINASQYSIRVALNYLGLPDVADALLRASKRGVNIKIILDNSMYHNLNHKFNAATYLVRKWQNETYTLSPLDIRIKYYSLLAKPHPKYWKLMHDKSMLIDYETPKTTVLIHGSYNYSNNSERSQYDNLIIYEGKRYRNVYVRYIKYFDSLWNLNRSTTEDEPINFEKLWMLTHENYLTINQNIAMSLTWQEVNFLQYRIKNILKERYRIIFTCRNEKYINIVADYNNCVNDIDMKKLDTFHRK